VNAAGTTISGINVGLKARAVEAAAIAMAPLAPFAGVYARAGVMKWHADSTASIGNISINILDDDGTNGIYGIGANANNGRASARFEIARTGFQGTRTYRYTLGVYWSFQ